MERRGAVPAIALADVGVRVDEAGHEHLARHVHLPGAGGEVRADGADLDDLPVLDDQHPVFDGRPGDGVDRGADVGRGLREQRRGDEEREQENEQTHECGGEVSDGAEGTRRTR